nr:hypothetical protein [Inquilinus limosus]
MSNKQIHRIYEQTEPPAALRHSEDGFVLHGSRIMTVVHLHHSAHREPPDAEHVSCDQWGRPMFRFTVEYPHLTTPSGRGRIWTAVIWAYDEEDAEARLAAIRNSGRLAGQVLETGSW